MEQFGVCVSLFSTFVSYWRFGISEGKRKPSIFGMSAVPLCEYPKTLLFLWTYIISSEDQIKPWNAFPSKDGIFRTSPLLIWIDWNLTNIGSPMPTSFSIFGMIFFCLNLSMLTDTAIFIRIVGSAIFGEGAKSYSWTPPFGRRWVKIPTDIRMISIETKTIFLIAILQLFQYFGGEIY